MPRNTPIIQNLVVVHANRASSVPFSTGHTWSFFYDNTSITIDECKVHCLAEDILMYITFQWVRCILRSDFFKTVSDVDNAAS